MHRFTNIESVAAPVAGANVDTDQIIPARFLQKPRSGGCGQFLFHDLRFTSDGAENPGFILNQPEYRNAQILVAGPNFGCGSSRENAVWALYDYGIRVVVAPGFGDIFYSNCLKNGLLPVVLPLLTELDAAPLEKMTVDLAAQTVLLAGSHFKFEIDPFARQCLLEGIDELDYTLSLMKTIRDFEAGYAG